MESRINNTVHSSPRQQHLLAIRRGAGCLRQTTPHTKHDSGIRFRPGRVPLLVSSIQKPVEIQGDRLDWMAVCCSILPPRSEIPSRHSGCLNKVTRGDFISHVDDGRRIRAASLRYGRCEMWRHQCMAGKVLVLFMPSGVANQGTWLQTAGLSRFGFPFGGPTSSAHSLPRNVPQGGRLPPM